LAARIIYTANINPLPGKAGTILAQMFKGYLDITGPFVAADKNFDPINKPYPYGKDDVKGKTPIELLVAKGNSGYLAMLLEAKRSDNGQSLVSLTTAQNALNTATDLQCKEQLEHFIAYENALKDHSDIMPFKDEELKNIGTLLHMLAQNIKDEEGRKAQQDLTTTIADRLHALLIYEVSKPTKEDKKTKALRRGDSKMVEKYLRYVNGLELMDQTKTLVDQPFSYGDITVKGKTPIELALKNKHKYCLKQMQDFLTKKVNPAAK
jgi:ankyrin repeat protein